MTLNQQACFILFTQFMFFIFCQYKKGVEICKQEKTARLQD